MLYVVPHFFVYSWEKNEKLEKKEYDLIIGIPNNFEEKLYVIKRINYKFSFEIF
jgi:hypothetical protein